MGAHLIRVLIVDDEPAARRRIRDLLDEEPDISIVGDAGEGAGALKKIKALEPDLVFLDIEMPGLTGLEMLRMLPAAQMPYIIFTTAFDNYAVDAFGLEAVDYLLKPIDQDRFRQALTRVRQRIAAPGSLPAVELEQVMARLAKLADGLDTRSNDRLAVKDGSRLYFLSLQDITYVRADGDYLHVHTSDGERRMIRESMRNFEQRLAHGSFMRISRSLLVNTRHVKEMKPTPRGNYEFMLSSGGERLTSGKTYREAVRRLLTEFRNPS